MISWRARLFVGRRLWHSHYRAVALVRRDHSTVSFWYQLVRLRRAVALVSSVLTHGGRVYGFGISPRSGIHPWGLKYGRYNPGELTNHWSTVLKRRRRPRPLTGRKHHRSGVRRLFRRLFHRYVTDLVRFGYEGQIPARLTRRLNRARRVVAYHVRREKLNFYRFLPPANRRVVHPRRRYSHSMANQWVRPWRQWGELERLAARRYSSLADRRGWLNLPLGVATRPEWDLAGSNLVRSRFWLMVDRRRLFDPTPIDYRLTRRRSKLLRYVKRYLRVAAKIEDDRRFDLSVDQRFQPVRSRFGPFLIQKYYPFHEEKRRWATLSYYMINQWSYYLGRTLFEGRPLRDFPRVLNARHSTKRRRLRRQVYTWFFVNPSRVVRVRTPAFRSDFPLEFDRIRTQKAWFKVLLRQRPPRLKSRLTGGYAQLELARFVRAYYRVYHLRRRLRLNRVGRFSKVEPGGSQRPTFVGRPLRRVDRRRRKYFPSLTVCAGLTGQKTGFVNEVQNSGLPAVVLHDLDFHPARAQYGVPWNGHWSAGHGWSSLIDSLWRAARTQLLVGTLVRRLQR